ncbi:MAG: hypothetical protein V4655_05330 [Bdellovibrionota bacterium]|nr:MAG: hypothetical protein EOP10_23150 [Pseudomonadota bacterium]
MRFLSLMTLTLASILAVKANAAPAAQNTLQAILEKSCQAGACAEGYTVKFKQITYENSREQVTLFLTLWPVQGITYPIIRDQFEAQLTQTSFAGVCRLKGIDKETFDAVSRAEESPGSANFRASLNACLSSLSARTETALGR